MPGWPLSEGGTLGQLEGLGGGALEGVPLLSSLDTAAEFLRLWTELPSGSNL